MQTSGRGRLKHPSASGNSAIDPLWRHIYKEPVDRKLREPRGVEFYTKAFFVALAIFVGYGLLLILQPFAGSMAWAIFLAFILKPLHRWLSRRLGNRPGYSAGIITSLTPFVLLIPLTGLGVTFADQARGLITYLQERNLKLDGSILLQLEQYPIIGPVARLAREELSVSAADIQEWITRAAEALLRNVASVGGGVVLSALGTLVGFFFMLFLLFFFLRDGVHVRPAATADPGARGASRAALRSPRECHARRVLRHRTDGAGSGRPGRDRICHRRAAVARGVRRARGGSRAASRGRCGHRVDSGGVVSVRLRPLEVGVFMLVWGLIVSTSDNFLRPILVSRYAPVSAFTVFVGVVGGIGAFGTIGIVVGPGIPGAGRRHHAVLRREGIAPNKRNSTRRRRCRRRNRASRNPRVRIGDIPHFRCHVFAGRRVSFR